MKFRIKHEPRSLSDLVFADQSMQELIADYVHGIREHHLILHGPAGSGKTQAAHIILQAQLGDMYGTKMADVFNGQGLSVNDIRTMDDMYNWQVTRCGKAVFLVDEVDFADTTAKRALRELIENKAYVTLICTTNHLHKLDIAFQNRFDRREVLLPTLQQWLPRAQQIMRAEGFQLTHAQLSQALVGFNGSARDLLNELENFLLTLKRQSSMQKFQPQVMLQKQSSSR
mgnify:FL=1